jgi:outer membrane receptor protein involved in Fe transport
MTMKSFTNTLQRLLLLAGAAWIAPGLAMAQDGQSPADAGPPSAEEALEDEMGSEESEEIVVLGRFIPEPMRQTSEVATFLSAEDLARQGDDNAAAALTRLSGLSVVSGRFVFVRGLGDRYSSAQLNGSPLPSPEPLRRTVPLDLFPSNVLEGAVVQKTFSPNFPGEFGGGIIDLRTVDAPNEPFFNLKLGSGFNTEAGLREGFVYRGGDYDWTGFDDGTRELPPIIANAVGTNRPLTNLNFTDAQLEQFGESLTNSPLTVVQQMEIPFDVEVEATGGASWDIGRYNLGAIGVVAYSNDWRARQARFGSAASTVSGVRDSTVWDITLNSLVGLSLGWDTHEIAGTLFYVHNTAKETQITATDDDNAGLSRQENTAWYERELLFGQLTGDHEWDQLELNWRLAASQSNREAPYNRYINYQLNPSTGQFFYRDRGNDNRTSFSSLTDEIVSGGADLTYTLPLSDARDLELAAGFDHSHTVRNFRSLDLAFTQLQIPLPADVAGARVDFLFGPDNIGPQRFQLRVANTSNVGYKGDLAVDAAYVRADVEIIPLVRLALGVRYEDAVQTVTSRSLFGTPSAPRTNLANTYWLPAATLTWNFAEDLQLRLGYSQTIARPQFRELGASLFNDPDTDRNYRGNPLLVDSELQNYDARLEYYFGRSQFVTGGLFYKTIENPIEEFSFSTGGGDITSFYNAPEAELYGVELEYRTRFESPFSGAFWDDRDWLFAVNYTYTQAEIVVDDPSKRVADPGRIGQSDPTSRVGDLVEDGSQLQGQSPHLANLQFGWESDQDELTLLVGYVDARVLERSGFTATSGGAPRYVDTSVVEEAAINVDLVYRRSLSILGRDYRFSLSGRNLLDEEHVETRQGTGEDINSYGRGMSFSVGLSTAF